MADANHKVCTRCGETKPRDAFHKAQGRCVPCLNAHLRERYAADAERRAAINAKNRAWAAANKEAKAAGDRAYAKANRARLREYKREYKLKHWDHIHAVQLQSRHRNLETYRAREAAYREKNREACNARIREWKAKNPDATLFYFHKRRALQLRAIPIWADLDAIAAIYKAAQDFPGSHVDHIVPLVSRKVCGLHCAANLQIIPADENIRKGNRWWPDMWEEE
jgi:hypothetical protein